MKRFEFFQTISDGLSFFYEIVNGEPVLIQAGDWYHDKIDISVSGFFDGLDCVMVPYELQNYELDEDYDYGKFNWFDNKAACEPLECRTNSKE